MSDAAQEVPLENMKPGDVAFEPDLHVRHDVAFAIDAMKRGKMVQRANWSRKDLRIGLQLRDAGSVNTEPYVYLLMPGADGEPYRVPWTCSQTDLLAHDWEIVE